MYILKIAIQILILAIMSVCWSRLGYLVGKRKGKKEESEKPSYKLSLREAISILADIDELIVVDTPLYLSQSTIVSIVYENKSMQGQFDDNDGITLLRKAMDLIVKSQHERRISDRKNLIQKCDFLAEKIAEKGNSIESIQMSEEFKKCFEKRFGITGDYIDPLGKAIKIKDLPSDFEIIFKDEAEK